MRDPFVQLLKNTYLLNISEIDKSLRCIWRKYEKLLRKAQTLEEIEEARAYLYFLGQFFCEIFGPSAIERRLNTIAENITLLSFLEMIDQDTVPLKYQKNENFQKLASFYSLIKKYKNLIKNGSYLDENRFDAMKAKILNTTPEKVKIRKHQKKLVLETQKIFGTIGCKGITRGRVKIIINENDFDKFQDGEILVSFITTPDYVPFIEKARGVITDIGGITYHAAIICRELGIPCIVGTKIATQILKDGMMVEVDASVGIITILPD